MSVPERRPKPRKAEALSGKAVDPLALSSGVDEVQITTQLLEGRLNPRVRCSWAKELVPRGWLARRIGKAFRSATAVRL